MAVRVLLPAVAASTVIHTAVAVWFATRPPTPPRSSDRALAQPDPAVEMTLAPPQADIAPIDVVLLDSPRLPAAAPARLLDEARAAAPEVRARPESPSPGAAPRGDRASAAGPQIRAGTTGAAPETARPTPDGHSLLAMRHGEAPGLALPHGMWDDLDHPPAGTTPERDRTSGLLHDAGGGSYRSDQTVFEARVHPDGSVKLKDSRNFHIHVALPSPRVLGRALASWYESDKGQFGNEGDASAGRQIQASSSSQADPVDHAKGQSGDRTPTVVVPLISGGFDVNDWLMRRHGQDPYAHRKLAFLDATRDERVQIGKRHRAAELARAPQIMQRNLDALWAALPDFAARKQALFELWDECAETGDPEVVAAGEVARRAVIGFIRARLPADSQAAYTAAEIAALARAQRSKAVFQPYE